MSDDAQMDRAERARSIERAERARSIEREARRALSSPLASLAAGVATSATLALIELVRTLLRAESSAPWGVVAIYLLGLWTPLGLAAGALVQGFKWLLQALPLALQRALTQPFAPNPLGFALAITSAFVLGAGALSSMFAIHHFATRYHDPQLAAMAAGVVVTSFFALAALLGAWLLRPLRRLGARMSRWASAGNVALLLLGMIAGSYVFLVINFEELRVQYGVPLLVGAPLSPLLLLFFAWRTQRWRLRKNAIWIAICAACALHVAHAYGGSNRGRGVVEQETVMGSALVRAYISLSDSDGDGHASRYGGRDCDDTRAWVHPGAYDAPGDGIDADCYDGDGRPLPLVPYSDGAYGPRPEGAPERPNFLFISLDALRFDHTNCSDYPRETSPHLAALCARGAYFEHVYATSTRSLRSIPSMRSGLYPSELAYGEEGLFPAVLPSNTLMEERLQSAGYRNSVTVGTNYFQRIEGFFQGYTHKYQSPDYKPPIHQILERAKAQIRQAHAASQPWLQWVHLFNTHRPYLSRGEESRFGRAYVDHYDTSIAIADEGIGALIALLEELGVDDQTYVIVTSDHGEAFYEHGYWAHARHLYDEELRSGMVIAGPGIEPTRIAQRVSLMDLAPTILNLADIAGDRMITGRSLLPLINDPEGAEWPQDRALFAELLPDAEFAFDQNAVLLGDYKLIRWVREGRVELYNLREDPKERRDLRDEEPERAREMEALITAWAISRRQPSNRHDRLAANLLSELPTPRIALNAASDAGFTIVGADIAETRVRRGDRLAITLYFEVHARVRRDVQIRVRADNPSLARALAGDHTPVGGLFPMTLWQPGQKIRDHFEIPVPPNASAQATHLFVSIPGVRFRVGSDEWVDSLDLGEVVIR